VLDTGTTKTEQTFHFPKWRSDFCGLLAEKIVGYYIDLARVHGLDLGIIAFDSKNSGEVHSIACLQALNSEDARPSASWALLPMVAHKV